MLERDLRLGIFAKIAALLLASALAAGCAQIPTSGEVRLAPPGSAQEGSQPGSEFLYFSPSGPVPGASREEVLSGFFSAATGPQNDFAVAREFLTDTFRARWNPNVQVLVQSSAPTVNFNDNNLATAEVQIQAVVDEQGSLSILESEATQILNFQLVEEDGEWRISQAPDSTLVIRPVFDVIYKAYSLYFLDPTSKFLVPDVRWFPARASTPNRIVFALQNGPSPWLADAVQNPIASVVNLGVNDLSIIEGRARVNLDLNEADVAGQLPLIDAQLRASLQQVTSITAVEVLVQGERKGFQPLVLTEALAPVQSPIALQSDGRVFQLLGGNLAEIPELRALVTQSEASWVQLANDSQIMALGNQTSHYLVDLSTPSKRLRILASGADLPVPIFDRFDYLWRWSGDRPGLFDIVSPSLSRSSIELGWPANRVLVSARLSPDGMRLAVVTSSPFGESLWLMSVVRDSLGKPIGLGAPAPWGPDLVAVRDLSWVDLNTIAVLDERTTGSASVLLLTQGGFSRSLTSLKSAKTIIGTGSLNNIYALNEAGQILQYRGMTWVDTRNAASWLTVR